MPTTIKLKNSVTTTNAPSSLAQGEVAINVTDKKVWVGNAATTPVQLLGTGADGSLSTLTVGAGTVSLPSITTTGDTNTGIYFPAADTIAFTEGGAESMRITSAGDVGIGTSSPTNFGSNFKMLAVQGSDFGVIQAISNSGSTTLEMMGSSGIGYVGTRTNHPVAFRTNDTERMRIDSSGNVGIGTSSPSTFGKFAIANGSVVCANPSNGENELIKSVFSNGLYPAGVYTVNSFNSNLENRLTFKTTSASGVTAEAMRIDGAGNLLVGTTSTINVTTGSATGAYFTPNGTIVSSTSNDGSYFRRLGADGNIIAFYKGTSSVGSISVTASATSFNTSSDYRLKENIAPMTGALGVVQQLKPVTYNWKVDGSEGQGFIAHELQEVVPDAVVGEKDAVDSEGKPVYQGIDTSFLVATLTASIQELKAIVDAQAERIAALESK